MGWLLTGLTPWKSLSLTAWAGSPEWSRFHWYDFNDARKCRAAGSGAGQDKWEEVGSAWEIKVKHSGEGKRAGNFLSLLAEPKHSCVVVEILCWFQVLSYNGLCTEELGDIWNWFFFLLYLGHARAAYWGDGHFYLKQTANGTVNIWAAREESAFLLDWQHRKKDSERLVRVSVWYPETGASYGWLSQG